MVLRSLMFVPGSSPKMIAKAASLPADAIVFDLEDAVAYPEKADARRLVRDALGSTRAKGSSVFVRINALSTGLTGADLDAIVCEHLDGVLMPKAETPEEVQELDGTFRCLEKDRGLKPHSIAVVPLIEPARGLVNAYGIAAASRRNVAIGFGAGDFMRDLGLNASFMTPAQSELLYTRSRIVVCARAAGIQAVDTVYFGLLKDLDGLEKEARAALRLGFKGKALIHPSQIEIVNRVFSPSEEDVRYAKGLIAAFAEAEKQGFGAVTFEGRMVDVMSRIQAQELLDFAAIVAERDRRKASLRDAGSGA